MCPEPSWIRSSQKKSTENHWVFFLLEYLWLYFYLLYHGSLVEDGKGCSSVGVGPGGL